MSLQATLEHVDADVVRGDLGKARDRLTGLLRTYPDSLEARRMLGEVYWALRYPDRAGQHWYLFPDETPEIAEAKRAFAARYGEDPRRMLDAIRYRGGLATIRGTHAEATLRELARRGHVSDRDLESITRRREPAEARSSLPSSQKVSPIATAIVVSVLAIFVIGLVTVAGWGLGILR